MITLGGADLLIFIILLIPIYVALIYSYQYPEESILFGRRWMFKEEPELTEEAILLNKKISLIAIVVISFFLIFSIIKSLFL